MNDKEKMLALFDSWESSELNDFLHDLLDEFPDVMKSKTVQRQLDNMK